jgi:DNA polymerase-1
MLCLIIGIKIKQIYGMSKLYFIGNSEVFESTLYKQATIDECVNWLNGLYEVNLDTETEGMFNHANKIVMLQLNWNNISFVIDTRTIDISPLKEKLEKILVVGQNLKFDYKFLKLHGIELNNVYDTMLAECCLTNGKEDRELNLKALAKNYCNIELNKDVRNQFTKLNGQPFTESQIVYGVGDVTCLTEIKTKQIELIKKLDLVEWVQNEMDASLALADIEYNGMGFDKEAWLKLANKAELNVVNYTQELDELTIQEPKLSKFVSTQVQGNLFAEVDESFTHGRAVNIKWSSPTQMDKVFKALGLDIEKTGERFLTKYQTEYPLVKRFIDYKKQAKLVTTYGKKFLSYINPTTQRIHTSFWQILDTTRVSSGDKYSPNMQNIPAKVEYRNCFIPRKGFKMVSCDFSGQELRLTAFGSKEPLWVDAFNKGEDLHSNVASMVFKVPLENVRDKPDFLRGKSYRDAAKTVNFGLVYGMSKYKLADTLSIEVDAADMIIKNYFKATVQLNNFLAGCRAYGMKYGYIRCFAPYKIIRYFPKWKPVREAMEFKEIGSIERASMNTPIQSAGGQMTKRALVVLRNYIKDNNLQDKVYIVMTVHDQIDCEVEESFVEEWSLIQKEIMESAGREIITNIPVLSDITISDSWTK